MKQVTDVDQWLQESDAELEAWLASAVAEADQALEQLLTITSPPAEADQLTCRRSS